MDSIYTWIRNIVFVYLLMTIILHLLPDNKYKKYMRLFFGMVMVTIVLSPIASLTGLDDQLNSYVDKWYQEIAAVPASTTSDQFSEQIDDLEDSRYEFVIEEYKNTLLSQAESLAGSYGLTVVASSFAFEEDPLNEAFGRLSSVSLTVLKETETEAGESIYIEPVIVGTQGEEEAMALTENEDTKGLKEEIQRTFELEDEQVSVVLKGQ